MLVVVQDVQAPERRLPIDEATRRLDYGSQAAFSRAAKRLTGRSPNADPQQEARDINA